MIKLREDSAFWKAAAFAFAVDFFVGWLIFSGLANLAFVWTLFLLNPFLLAAYVYQFLAPKEFVFRPFLAGLVSLVLLELSALWLVGGIAVLLSASTPLILIAVTPIASAGGLLCTSIGMLAADVTKANATRKLP